MRTFYTFMLILYVNAYVANQLTKKCNFDNFKIKSYCAPSKCTYG